MGNYFLDRQYDQIKFYRKYKIRICNTGYKEDDGSGLTVKKVSSMKLEILNLEIQSRSGSFFLNTDSDPFFCTDPDPFFCTDPDPFFLHGSGSFFHDTDPDPT